LDISLIEILKKIVQIQIVSILYNK